MSKQVRELLAIVLIGDGMIGMMEPKRHALLWRFGPRAYRDLMQAFVERPGITQIAGMLEVGVAPATALRLFVPPAGDVG